MALDTVAEYVAYARVLLQDTVDAPYRYPDADLLLGLNLAIPEMKKLRPDLLVGKALPTFAGVDNTVVDVDAMYRVPVVFYMCGHAQLRDDEETQDQRAAAFLNMFTTKLLTVA